MILINFLTLDAQVKKARFYISGSNSLMLQNGVSKEFTDDQSEPDTEQSYFNIEFQPRIGYLFIDNLAIGLFIDADYYSSKTKEGGSYQKKSSAFILGPFARYYIPVSKKLIPFIEAQAGLGTGITKDSYNDGEDWMTEYQTLSSYRMAAGATLFFTRFIGADFSVGFNHESYKYKSEKDIHGDQTTETFIYNELLVQAGIVILIE